MCNLKMFITQAVHKLAQHIYVKGLNLVVD